MPTLDQLNHHIPLSEAIEMTKRFRDERENILKSEFTGKDILPLSETFNRSAFEDLLKPSSCAGIRAYLGMDADKKIRLIFVAVNAANEDILPSQDAAAKAIGNSSPAGANGDDDDEDDGGVIEEGQRCPPICPPSSPLNQP